MISIGSTWGEVEWGATPWDEPEALLDHRCPVEQSEQFYTALRKLGKEATFLRFQGESHTMGSTGRPKPRMERLRRLTAWFDRYLQLAAERAGVPGG